MKTSAGDLAGQRATGHPEGEALALVGEGEPLRDDRIIFGGESERFGREFPPKLHRRRAIVGIELGEQRGIVGRIGDDLRGTRLSGCLSKPNFI